MPGPLDLALTVAGYALVMISALLALMSAYLLVLTLGAVLNRRVSPGPGPGRRRFAILVPAHDEEPVLGRLLRSLAELDYAKARYDVCVVADNCQDRTAEIGRSMGARVYERSTPDDRAKGFALRWLLEQLRAEGRVYDAFVVLDADTVVEGDLLARLDARLEAGSQVVQVYYSVLNAGASAVSGLRFAALTAMHYLRPLGRSTLGLSCGLWGNGMCFTAPILDEFGWRWFTLAEDVEFHLALVRRNVRVEFAPETTVLADMPVTFAQAHSQNTRWERGRLQLLRDHVPRLLGDGFHKRNRLCLGAAADELIPPLSVSFAVGGLCVLAGMVVQSPLVVGLAGGCLVAQVAYLGAGLALVRAPLRAYVALWSAPVYIAWKVGLYGQALVTARTATWVRTARLP
jgi:cellulose synthase/poly-beta-1,6-N-acetylglucosamine synthase-like glycosyltransferase